MQWNNFQYQYLIIYIWQLLCYAKESWHSKIQVDAILSYLLSLVVMALALTGVTTNEVMARHPTIVTIISFSGKEEYGKWVYFDCFLNVLLMPDVNIVSLK